MRGSAHHDQPLVERALVEKMAKSPVLELIVGVKREENFGLALVLGTGGVLVELIRDTATLLLPVRPDDVRAVLLGLRPLFTGHRGVCADLGATVRNIMAIAQFALDHADGLVELDVNPLLVHEVGALAVDALVVLDR
jgi:acetate---CoA ligase (ADP-forming)